MLTSLSFQPSRQSVLGPPTPPGQRKVSRNLASITAPLTQRGMLLTVLFIHYSPLTGCNIIGLGTCIMFICTCIVNRHRIVI